MTNIIRKAAESLPGHWHKGSIYGGGDKYCAVGHMYKNAGFEFASDGTISKGDDYEQLRKAWDFVTGVVLEFTNGKYDELPDFNDAADTTEEDIVALLEKAAVKWDEQEGLS